MPTSAPVHAAGGTGQVCIISPNSGSPTNACPPGVSSFTGPPVQDVTSGKAQLRVNVNINGTAPISGFDIILTANASVLKPSDVDLTTNSVGLGGDTISTLCIGGNPVLGSCGSQANNNLTTLELGIGGTTLSPNPSYGTLFTAIYDIVGNVTSGKTVTIGFQTKCGVATSIPPTCITLTNGGSSSVAIASAVTATYATSAAATTPFWTFSSTTTTPVQAVVGGSTPVITVNINAFNGFTCNGVGCISAVARAAPAVGQPTSSGITATLNPLPNYCDPSCAPNSFTVSINIAASVPLGTYFLNVEGSVAVAPLPGVFYLASAIVFTVHVVDFSVSASPTSLTVLQGVTNTQAWSTITVSSIAGAQGTVALSCSSGCAPGTAGGPTAAFNVTSVTIAAGSTAHANFTITAGTSTGTFSLTVRGTMSGVSRITLPRIGVTVLASTDYYLTANPSSNSALVGVSSGSSIKVVAGSASHGSVALSVASISPSTGLTCNPLSPSSSVLPVGGTSTLSCSATAYGTYTVTVNGVNATTIHSTTVTLIEQDFQLATDQSSVTTILGNTAQVVVTATGFSGFAGNITLTSSYSAPGISCGFQVQKPPSPRPDTGYIVIPPTIGSDNMECTGTADGSYTVTVTATFGVLVHTRMVTFSIQDFALTAKPTSVATVLNTPGVSTINASSIQGYGAPSGVAVTLTVQSPTGLVCSLNPTTVHLSANSSISQLSCTSSSTLFTNAKVNVTGTSGSLPPRTVTVLYTVIVGHATTTSVACVPATAAVGTSTTCTATVTDTDASPTNPTGTVSFSNGGASGTFTPSSCTLTASGTTMATCNVAYVPGAVGSGTQSISASYHGDSTHSASSSTSFGLTVTKKSPTLTTTSSAASITTGSTASDSSSFGSGTTYQPTGTVSYLLFSASYCSGSSGTVSVVTITSGSIPNSRSVTFNSTGTYGFEASYAGDGNNNAVTSSCETVTVTAPILHNTTVAVSCSPSSIDVNIPTSCTVTVTDTDSSPTTPTGTVTFSADAGTFSGSSTCSLTAGSTTGVATCSIAYTATGTAGSPTITSSYGGDSTHKSGSGTTSLTVTQPSPVMKILGLDPTVFYSILGAIIAAIAIAAAAIVLRRRKKPQASQTVAKNLKTS